jgi:hypothetical protein
MFEIVFVVSNELGRISLSLSSDGSGVGTIKVSRKRMIDRR